MTPGRFTTGWATAPQRWDSRSNASDWFLGWLADKGVEVIFGNPGSTELPLVDALARQDRIRYVLGLHESAVMGMADGYAQQGDRLGVVNVHVQPGLANAMSGILNAARARVPLLVTVGQQVTSLLGQAPFLGGELVKLAQPIAKAAIEVSDPRNFPEQLSWAYTQAMARPRGPVVLSIPMDIQAGPIPRRSVGAGVAYPHPDPDLFQRAAEMLANAKDPIILAGDGVAHERAWDRLREISDLIGAPIMGEPFAARVPIPAKSPLWRGPLPGFASEIAPILDPHDAVLAVGMPVFRVFGTSPGDVSRRFRVRLIHLDPDPVEVGRVFGPKVGIVCPVAPGLAAIADHLHRLGPRPSEVATRAKRVRTETARLREEALQRLSAASAGEGEGVSGARLCTAIAAAVGPDDLVVDEALTSGRWLRTALGARNTPRNWLAHRGSALGWGLPAAVGAKRADWTRRVMCVHGDGSFLFGVHALWTAARERLGVAVVVADNSGYEILRAGLEGLTGRAEGDWPGLELVDPKLDLVAISRGFGASAERIDRREQLDDALADVWRRAESGPAVLVVPVTGRTPAVGYPV